MRKRHLSALSALSALAALAMMLSACARSGPEDTAAPSPARVVEPRGSDRPAARGVTLLRRAMLDGHNRARALVGVPPLVWDDSLAAAAHAYAQDMARTRRFAHAVQPIGAGRQGENLWTGTRYAYRYDEMIGHWLAESRDFIDRPTPDFSRTGRWQDVGHYTQIVWRGSTAVGCAVASNARDDYLVCRYAPPGNVMGQAAF